MSLPNPDASQAPGPPGLPLVGNLFDFRKDALRLVVDAHRQYGDVVRFRLGPMLVHLLCHPDHVEHVLVRRAEIYDKSTRSASKIRSITGDGLLTSNGDAWHRQRRLMQPAFNGRRIDTFVPMMADATEQVLRRWTGSPARRGGGRRLGDDAADVHGRRPALFGSDVTRDIDAVEQAAGVILGHTYKRLERLIDAPDGFPTPGNVRFRRAMRTIDRVVQRIVRERQSDGSGSGSVAPPGTRATCSRSCSASGTSRPATAWRTGRSATRS